MMRKPILITLSVVFVVVLSFFMFSKKSERVDIVVSIKPIHSLVCALTKGVTTPVLLLDGSVSPHHAQLQPSQVQKLKSAKFVVWIGPVYEQMLTKHVKELQAAVVTLQESSEIKLKPLRNGALWDQHACCNHDHAHYHDHDHHHHDYNLRAAYIHVLADALTSVLAIIALLAGKFLDWIWLDAVMGLVGAVVIAKWAYGLVKDTGLILLDGSPDKEVKLAIIDAIEQNLDNRVTDLHVWNLSQQHLAVTISLVTHHPQQPEHYKNLLSHISALSHVVVEVNQCQDELCSD